MKGEMSSAALRAPARLVHQVVESSGDMIAEVDPEGYILYVSPSLASLMSHQQRPSIRDFVFPEDHMILHDTMRVVLDSHGRVASCKFRIRKDDERYFWIGANFLNLAEQEGMHCIVVTMRDITHTIMHEQALREKDQNLNRSLKDLERSGANLSAIFKNTQIAYTLLDKDFTVVASNPQAGRWVMHSYNERLKEGKKFTDYFEGKEKDRIVKVLTEVLKGKNAIYEVNKCLTSGEERWYKVRMNSILSADKNVYGICISTSDVTETKQQEIQIREHNERFRLAGKATKDIIWDWDITNNKLYWSENYERIFGYSLKPVHGIESWSDYLYPDDKDEVLKAIHAALDDRDTLHWEGEYRFILKDGSVAYIHDRGYKIINEGGTVERMVGAMTDITERKLSELKNERITSQLLSRNNQLEQFTYIISHNLRAPVANILALTAHLQESFNRDAKDDLELFLQALSQSSGRLDEVIKDLNSMLQIRRDAEIGDKETVSLDEVLRSLKEIISMVIEKEQVVIESDFSEAGTVYAIKSFLHSIFINIVSNAIKYARPGVPPRITIKSSLGPDSVRLAFSDNGLGFEVKQVEEAFGLYKRFHAHKEGKGIGLFMTKTQIESLGGKISLESMVNTGSTITVELPLNPL